MTEALFQPPTSKDIDTCTAELAVAFQRKIDAGTIKIYRETMSDLPIWAIQEAALRLRRKGGTFFPGAPEWHSVAEQVIHDRNRELIASRPAEPRAQECETCRDTGWVEEDRGDRSVCIPCSCRPWNTTYQRMTKGSCRSQNELVKK